MPDTTTDDERRLLELLPSDGREIGNGTLREQLHLDERQYTAVVERLLANREIARGVGRGGSLKRAAQAREEELLLARVPADGSSIGNGNLRRQLGWSEEKYFPLRDLLVEQGLLVKGRGRGGTVRREVEALSAPPAKEAARVAKTAKALREADHYDSIEKVLRESWSKERGFIWSHVENTAAQGRRDTGGRWSRPDLAVISLKKFAYLPATYLEVATFEVKLAENLDVTAVYEALAHARSATRSYVVCVGRAGKDSDDGDTIATVREESARHRVGFILAEKAGDFDTWEELVEAPRREVEPERLNEFISTQCSGELQSKLR